MTKKRLYKISDEGKIMGVCAGLAEFFNIDVTIIRLIWLLAVFFAIGSPILVYFIVAIILPTTTRQKLTEMDYVMYDEDGNPYDPKRAKKQQEYDEYDDGDRYDSDDRW